MESEVRQNLSFPKMPKPQFWILSFHIRETLDHLFVCLFICESANQEVAGGRSFLTREILK